MEEPKISLRLLVKRVLGAYRDFKRPAFILLGFLVIREGLSIAAPYLTGNLIDHVVRGSPARYLYAVLGVIFGIALLRVGLQYVSERVEIAHIDFDVRRHVAETSMRRVLEFSIGQHLSRHSGFKESVLGRGEDSLTNLAQTFIYQIVPLALQVGFATVFLLVVAPPVGVMVAAGVGAFIWITIRTNQKLRDDLSRLDRLRIRIGQTRFEMIQQVGAIKMHAKESEELGTYGVRYREVGEFGKPLYRRLVRRITGRELVVYATEFAVMAFGVFAVSRGVYSIGSLVVFFALSSRSFGQLHALGRMHRQLVDQAASVTRYFRMLDAEPDITMVPNPIRPEQFAGRIEFRNVSFSYPARKLKWDDDEEENADRSGRDTALHDVSFTVEPGQKVAIVGPSGAGKSTIVHLLIRAYDPSRGQVLVDGHDLRLLDLTRFRRVVGTVPQDVSLFDGSIRRNIAFGLEVQPDAVSVERLREVAALSCVDRFVDRLEYGFETIVGERGVRLSGGERQRVDIARALIKEPAILIFDEATSNLDTENERLIQDSIRTVSAGRTTIVIAHRLSTVKDADKILVMEKGRIVGEGTHGELFGASSVYQRLVQNQTVIVG